MQVEVGRELSYEFFLRTGPFDVIFLLHTLEHFADPRQTLEGLGAALSAAGIICVEFRTSRRAPLART
jgi:2-polyprenyl-3-methyl-5-hydroxy-6-metoxy-1,4-benzoquinol methylase